MTNPRHARSTGPTLALSRRMLLVLGTVLACVIELSPWHPTELAVVAGGWLVLVAPTVLLRSLLRPVLPSRDVCWLVAGGFAVITAIVVALLVNTLLPLVGLDRPLSTPSLAIASALAVLGLAAVDRWRSGPTEPVRMPSFDVPTGIVPVALLGAACLVCAVAGAIRLNNGFGSTGSLVDLLLIAAQLGLVLVRHRTYGGAVTALAIYCAAAALLLLTSLRGWYITGHDIQREYLVFELTNSLQHWSIAAFRDPYNACLSITLLPTSLTRLTDISGLYVFKVVFPLLFAVTPVLVYRAGRNLAGKPVALLGAIYFLAFPTFFTDMTFIGRQEIAFLVLGCAILVVSERDAPVVCRRILFVALLCGIVLSHYSTTYVLIGMLALGKLAGHLLRLVGPVRRRLDDRTPRTATGAPLLTWWMVGAIALAAFLWTGPATDTAQQVEITTAGTAQDIFDPGGQQGSSDTAYSLFSDQRVTPEQRLRAYASSTAAQARAGRASGEYEPQSVVDKYPVTVAPEQNLPLTGFGRMLSALGIPVPAVNNLVRTVFADALQLLLILGLIGTVLGKGKGFRPSYDAFVLSIGGLAVIALETLLPQLSVDYSVLRTFQQGLLVFAPFVAVASTWIFRWLGRWQLPAAATLALLFFLDITGVLPTLVGGYPAQLQLANSGQYYDIYYVHPQERTAIVWLEARSSQDARDNVQSEVQTDRYTFSRLQTLISGRADDDIYPTLVRSNSYVFLGFTTVTKDQATLFYGGDLVTYRYPVGFLDSTKNKIYSSDGASVYR
ncbi:MAG TPA: DUF2206 domain-containing protein [Pseudonocardiaceae bacterium]|nr:DUF2206 domain-containing protein [Pseudonocardiaceae bacterium]